MIVSGPRPEMNPVAALAVSANDDARKGERRVYFGPESGFVNAPVYDRYCLVPGKTFEGPAIVEERESTTIVPPHASACIDAALNLVIDLPA